MRALIVLAIVVAVLQFGFSFKIAVSNMAHLLRFGFPAALSTAVLTAMSVAAQTLPPSGMLDEIFPVQRHKASPGFPTLSSFSKAPDRPVEASCGLAPIDLTQTTGPDKFVFKLLGTPQSDTVSEPNSMLINLSRMTVNADGSRRAYHPADPFGLCQGASPGNVPKACALDVLGDAEILVYQGSDRISQFIVPEGQNKPGPNPVFAKVWDGLWQQISARDDQWVDLRTIFGKQAPTSQHLYYSPKDDAAAVFNSNIIPFKDAYPCQFGDRTDNYFVAATTPHAAAPDPTHDACSIATFLDSVQIPFFVLPGGVFKNLRVGDVAIGWAKIGAAERVIYGVVGDTGPEQQIGEGSISLVRQLRGAAQPNNATEVRDLDLKIIERPAGITSLAVLVLGETAKDIGFDFSAANIEKVARNALQKWASGHAGRLQSCADAAPVNPFKGAKIAAPN
jgi:hypothetical protein